MSHHLQGEQGDCGKIQASQPDLSVQEDYGTNPLRSHFQAHDGQEDNWEQPAWI